MRERLRQDVALSRESKKLMMKSSKETKEESRKRRGLMSDRNKIRAQYRKDFSSDLKRVRGDATVCVLHYFDEEENREEQEQRIRQATPGTPTSLLAARASAEVKLSRMDDTDARKRVIEDFFSSLPSCSESLLGYPNIANMEEYTSMIGDDKKGDPSVRKCSEGADDDEDINWGDIFQAANCLYAFSDYLQLQIPIRVTSLVEKVAKASSTSLGRVNQNQNQISGVGVIESIDTAGVEGRGDSDVTAVLVEDDVTQKGAEHALTSSVEGEGEGDQQVVIKENHMKDSGENEWDEIDDKSKKDSQYVSTHSKTDSNNSTDSPYSSALMNAQADLDRIHLCLVSRLSSDLHSLLDLDETDKGSAVTFPLNQVHNCVFPVLH